MNLPETSLKSRSAAAGEAGHDYYLTITESKREGSCDKMILNTKTFRALSVSHEGRQKDEVRHGIWKDIKEAAGNPGLYQE